MTDVDSETTQLGSIQVKARDGSTVGRPLSVRPSKAMMRTTERHRERPRSYCHRDRAGMQRKVRVIVGGGRVHHPDRHGQARLYHRRTVLR